ncbi:ATP-binding protein [Vibrio fluvialis]|uniref:ATP-binding protein n=1 Tax=Vibrio fluvialis TaxID=676 RepID=UPI0013026BA2|nr:ATP-binding protein [Vibrio fluvialis]MBL4261233.1 ATP-binding protein [Vibrio fluvialis]MBY7824901.1 ATP-binding protein [Vibrio fluvialis]MBY7984150.1 ATP-binding protein [Vibrio fluvialis]MBY8108932.1 ATP-binding protein [Vibrio fluvialis]MBY8157956.1 ATP-binding protein [Vibrio fluvialis]
MPLTLTLIRGLPGSGKSTLAKTLPGVHLEADMFFENAQGEYHYRPELISKAHEWCQRECERALAQGNSVVVANTFVRHWEMSAYKKLARKYRARLVTKVCRGDFPNVHGVDSATIERMRQKWQD